MAALTGLVIRFFELLAVSVWLGGIAVLSSLVAPTLFAKMPTRAQSGEMFGYILSRFYVLEIALGVLLFVFGMLRWKYFAAPMGFSVLRLVLLALMIGATLTAQFYIRPQLKELRQKIGSFEKAAEDHPDRVLFGKLHQQSVMLMSFNLLGAMLLLVLLVWNP